MQTLTPTDASNWKRWPNFCAFDPPPTDHVMLEYYHPATGDCLQEANATVIERTLVPLGAALGQNGGCMGTIHTITFQLVDEDGKLTPCAQAWNALAARYDAYPCLDEDLWSEYEARDQLNWVRGELNWCGLKSDTEPSDDIAYQVLDVLQPDGCELPSCEDITEALQQLGLWEDKCNSPSSN